METVNYLFLLKCAYEAGQKSVYCGCYEINDCTTFDEWYKSITSELNDENKDDDRD